MAIFYLRSTTGSDANSGATWALAKATLAGAFAAMAAGDTCYVSQVHAETQATTMTLTSPGTAALPCFVVCANDGAEPPTAVATTATISTTGGNNISLAGYAYVYGIAFQAGTTGAGGSISFTAAGNKWWKLDTCTLRLSNTSAGGRISFGAGAGGPRQLIELVNTVLSFGHVSQGVNVRCPVIWTNTVSAIGGTVPTTLFIATATPIASNVRVLGVDLSALGSGNNLVDLAAVYESHFYFENCKLGASVSPGTGTIAGPGGGADILMVNCNSGNVNYAYYYQNYQGTITQETTVIRSGGASDGVTPISFKMVSTANTNWGDYLISDPVLFWVDTTGSQLTATIEVLTDGVTLTDAEAWLEIEALTTSGFPLAVFTSDRATSILTTPANQTTSTVTWTTSGISSPVKQKLSRTFTPQMKGFVRGRIVLARPSTTMYYDPLLTVG